MKIRISLTSLALVGFMAVAGEGNARVIHSDYHFTSPTLGYAPHPMQAISLPFPAHMIDRQQHSLAHPESKAVLGRSLAQHCNPNYGGC